MKVHCFPASKSCTGHAICHTKNKMCISIHGQAYYGYEIRSCIEPMTLRAGLGGQVLSKSRLSSPVRVRDGGIWGGLGMKIGGSESYWESTFIWSFRCIPSLSPCASLFSPFLLLQSTFSALLFWLRGYSLMSFEIDQSISESEPLIMAWINITPHQ